MNNPILLPCADGSDQQCYGKIEADSYSDDYFKLTEEQQNDVEYEAETHRREDGCLQMDFVGQNGKQLYIEVCPGICASCGNDYSRNEDGDIID